MKIKRVEDYFDQVQEQFPELDRKELEKVLRYGLKSFYMTNLYGADVLVKNRHFTLYVGQMIKNVKKFWEYWHHKHALKLRIKYKRKRPPYDGYYYFGLSEEDYKKYGLDKKKGRKSVTFEKIWAFKIMKEAFLDYNRKYFFKLAVKEEGDFLEVFENLKTSQFSLIAKRDSNQQIKML